MVVLWITEAVPNFFCEDASIRAAVFHKGGMSSVHVTMKSWNSLQRSVILCHSETIYNSKYFWWLLPSFCLKLGVLATCFWSKLVPIPNYLHKQQIHLRNCRVSAGGISCVFFKRREGASERCIGCFFYMAKGLGGVVWGKCCYFICVWWSVG